MNKIIFIDTLTTGMDPIRCGLYRIAGIVTYDGVEQERFDIRMRPFLSARINEQSLWIGGETRQSISGYPSEKEALESFLSVLKHHVDVKNPNDKAYLAGFNVASNDTHFLREWFRRCGNERFRDYFHVQAFDLMCFAAFMLKDRRHTMDGFHLENVARAFEIETEYDGKCSCLRNAKTCLDLYRSMESGLGLGECTDTRPTEKLYENI